jgi:phospholipid/cholesterol/gamma-HCH transport system substrate-binding protein
MRELSRAITQSNGTLSRLLNDPQLYNHLDEAACMLTKIMPRVDRAMKDIEVFTDKLARHPELIGLGGVTHPSNGIKDATPAIGSH